MIKKYKILGAAKKLREARDEHEWKNTLFIAPDLTVKQQIKQKELWEELKQRRAAGENDIRIRNFRIEKVSPFRQRQ